MIRPPIITVEEGLPIIAYDLFMTKMAERTHNIYLQRKHRSRFEFMIRGLEESQDFSMHTLAKPYRTLMEELN